MLQPATSRVHLDRWTNTSLLVPATATSSSNALAVAAFMVLREAVVISGLDWSVHGPNMADACMAIFLQTGRDVFDDGTRHTYIALDLLAALRFVLPDGLP